MKSRFVFTGIASLVGALLLVAPLRAEQATGDANSPFWQHMSTIRQIIATFPAGGIETPSIQAYHRGLDAYSRGNFDAAITAFREAMNAPENAAVCHYAIACCLHGQGKFAEAQQEFRQAHQADATLPDYVEPTGP